MNASRNIWAFGLCDLDPMSSKNRRSYNLSNWHGWSSKRVNYEFSRYVFEWSSPLSNAETDGFSTLQENELFYLQVPVRSRASIEDINHCSYEDVNESGFQICDDFEDSFDEIEDLLEGRKGWGDYFDDGDQTDGSEISDGDPCNIDHCSQYHSEEIESSETDELGFQDYEIGTEDDEEAPERIMMMHEI